MRAGRSKYEELWTVVAAQFPLGPASVHGPRHWRRVEENGLLLAAESGADVAVVSLFAIFHDARRQNDAVDRGHGRRGGDLASGMRGTWFDLPDAVFALLLRACRDHTDVVRDPDITVGTCWDADRLDLPRVGITPDPERMATDGGRRMAAALRTGTEKQYR